MTRRYTPAAGNSSSPRLTPSPTPQGPRAGIQVVTARAPRVGPSAAEEIDGGVPPIDLAEGLPMPVSDGNGQQWPANDSTLSNGSRQHVVNAPILHTACQYCAATEETDLLIPGNQDGTNRGGLVCAACVERLVDRLRAELPRRRLRLAMERLAAGQVTPETLATIERLAAQHTDSPATEDKA